MYISVHWWVKPNILSPIASQIVLMPQYLSWQLLSLNTIISFSTQFFLGCTWPLSQASWALIFWDNIVYSFIWWHQTFFCLKQIQFWNFTLFHFVGFGSFWRMMNNEIIQGAFRFPSGALFIMGFRPWYLLLLWWLLLWFIWGLMGNVKLGAYVTELFTHSMGGYSPKARLVYYA